MEEKKQDLDIQQETKPSKTFFQKIAFTLLDNERKTEIAGEIVEDAKFGKGYRLQIILSVTICTLGLLINSVPVIIGAMLIAPILTPIKIIAFSTATGNGRLYNRSLKISALSIAVAIAIAWIITHITPLATLTPEIFARTSPTIIDLFIALASGIIAFLSIGFQKLREKIAGVAMAIALVPPLCVVGIGIHFLNLEITKGSFLLFITNFVAIILVGIILFFAFGFFPTNPKGKKHSIESLFLTVLVIGVIISPLIQSMRNIAEDIQVKQTIKNVTNEFLTNINNEIEIEKISHQIQDNILRISATIDVPSTTVITEQQKNELSQILATTTEKSVNLDLNIVSISSVLIEKREQMTEQEISNEEMLQQKIKEYIGYYTGVIVIEFKLTPGPHPLIYLNLFGEDDTNKEKIEKNIEIVSKQVLGPETNVLIIWH